MTTDGVGKRYSLVAGEPLSATSFEMRFGKPAGWRYAEVYARLQSLSNRRGSSLWRRMMVLGPAPEFCLVAPAALELPLDFKAEVLRREPI